MEERKILVQKAKWAEQAERYDDMADAMKQVTEKDSELTEEERNLLSVAYKNVVGARRASFRVISSIESKSGHGSANSERHLKMCQKYREKIHQELRELCNAVLELLDKHLLPGAAGSDDSTVFYLKMKGDYYRYLAEVADTDNKKESVSNAKEAYCQAYDLSSSRMLPSHPIRLGLALNFSVFHYEILCDEGAAIKLAGDVLKEATSDSDISEDSFLILQLLKDNLMLWTTDLDPQEETDIFDNIKCKSLFE